MCMCVHHEIIAHVLIVDSVTSFASNALTHITPDVPGLIGVSAEDHGASQQQAVQLLG